MSVIFILVLASLIISVSFLIAFIWSVKSNQYEDDYTPSIRILFDNDTRQANNEAESILRNGTKSKSKTT